MAIIHPFQGWRPTPEKAPEISSVPYDVISASEAAELAEGKEESFLHVIRPEIDLPAGTPFHADEVYEKGAENLKKLLQSPSMEQDKKSSLYVYQLETEDRKQTGLFACVSVEDYDNDVILKHELTRPDKEDDRTRHILTQEAHAEPVMLTFKDEKGSVTELMEKTMRFSAPEIEFQAEGGVWHRIWPVSSPVDLVEQFVSIPKLYVADGHHRCKSASRASEELHKSDSTPLGEAEYDYFPAVLFPIDQMKILPYNRIIKKVSEEQFARLRERFDLQPDATPSPRNKGEISIYYDGAWYGISLPDPKGSDAVSQLDVQLIQEEILSPIFGIENPRTNPNIDFVGGIRGTSELEKRVDSGDADLAISTFATAIEELVQVSDDGQLMPPKSTWFEPKIRSGLIIHTF
ncbi:MAG: DUF1015 domain-containing protein [Bacteroidota bacterium]